jgi:hypothetical protein
MPMPRVLGGVLRGFLWARYPYRGHRRCPGCGRLEGEGAGVREAREARGEEVSPM